METRRWSQSLRSLAVEAAECLSGAHLAAGQGHGLKGPFIPEFRLEIRLLGGPARVARKLLRARVLLSHKLVVALHQANRGCSSSATFSKNQTTTNSDQRCCHL